MKRKTLFVVDGNWYLHRCWHTLRTERDIGEALAYAFVGLVMKDACAVKADYLEVAFDGPKVFRHALYEGYKAGRDTKKEEKKARDKEAGVETHEIYKYLPQIFKYLEKAGIRFITRKKYEADDILCTRATQYSKKYRVVLGTKDKDNYQSLTCDNVRMYDSTAKDSAGNPKPRYITAEIAEKQKGCKVHQMVSFQTLYGDSIDSIPQYLSLAKVKKVLAEYDTISNWYKEGSKEDKKWLKKNQVRLNINRQLVMLVKDAVPKEELESFVVPKMKIEGMPRRWYDYQNFLYPKSKGLFGAR